jgi:hypothetical protein
MSNQKRIMPAKNQNNFMLKNLKPNESFKVPKGYFETFPERLRARIHLENETSQKKSTIFSFTFTKVALAASFIGLMIITYSGIKFAISKQQMKAGIQQNVITELSDNDIYELDETMLYDLYSETITDNNSINSVEKNNTDEMINYLILEDSDIEILIQEL